MIGAGVILALAYIISGNIWFPTALHFGWNFAQGVLLSIPVSGLAIDGFFRLQASPSAPQYLTGGEFGLEASAATTLVELVMIALLVAVAARRARQPAAGGPG